MTTHTPLMSVIIIVKDNEDLLPRAIESALAQTQDDFELVIINDGSTDSTGKIIDSFQKADSRVKPHHLDTNIGRSSARNIGLDTSRGKYITFLDADDYLPKTAIADLSSTAEDNDADIVFGRIKAFNSETGEWIKGHYTDIFMTREHHGIEVNDLPELLHNHAIVGRCYRRDYIKKNNIRFSTKRRNAEDVTFSFYSKFYAQRISIIPNSTVYFYSAGNFIITANRSKVEDARDSIIEILDHVYQHAGDNIIETMQKKSAIFAGNLGRAKEVFGMTDELRNYLPSLVPLVNRASEELLDTLPPYYQRFARAIRAYDFDRAFYLFENKNRFNNSDPIRNISSSGSIAARNIASRLKQLISQNQRLANDVDALYDSKSWVLTAPLRAAIHIYRRIIGKLGNTYRRLVDKSK